MHATTLAMLVLVATIATAPRTTLAQRQSSTLSAQRQSSTLPAQRRPSTTLSTSNTRHKACCIGRTRGRVCWRMTNRGTPFNILFHSNQLGERGTETAMFDYAHYIERHACSTAFVAYFEGTNDAARAKFEHRFPGRIFVIKKSNDSREVQALVDAHGIDAIYTIQADTFVPPALQNVSVPTMTHGVFYGLHDAGPTVRHAVISPGLNRTKGTPVVPHVVDPTFQRAQGWSRNLRLRYGIPEDAVVLCRHGGYDTFDIQFVRDTLCKVLHGANNTMYALLMNTSPLECSNGLDNVIHLPVTTAVHDKLDFLATCDACLHARIGGETFGLAVAECSTAGLPVVTYSQANRHEDFHIRVLREHGLYYKDGDELTRVLQWFDKKSAAAKADVYAHLYDKFNPSDVMFDFVLNFGILDAIVSKSTGRQALEPPFVPAT